MREGEIFGLLGPSGAGKSTTQKILVKLLDDYQGSIQYFGRDLRAMGHSFYEEIGVGFEMPVHFTKLTGLENMEFFAGFYSKTADIQELMERVGLWEYRHVKVGEYSKGMKVRLNFVRAMLNRPRVLFLDEVTNGLDPKNARIIKDMIAEYRDQGGTVFLTTHLMNDVEQLCDRVAFCVNGRLAEVSTPRDLKLKYGKREVKVEYRQNGRWIALFLVLSPDEARSIAPLVIFVDVAAMSILLLGASHHLEKQDGTMRTMLVLPVSVGQILAAKTAAALVLAVESVLVTAGALYFIHQVTFNYALLFCFVLISGTAHAAIGLTLSLKSRDFTSMLGLLLGYMLIFTLPSLLFSLGAVPERYEWLFLLSPSHAASHLISSAVLGSFQPEMAAAACAYLALLAAVLFRFVVGPRFKDNAMRG